MTILRRLALAALFALALSPAFAQAPPPVPALPDSARQTSYTIASTTCGVSCPVNFALYGNAGVGDYYDWVEVYLNGVRVNYNDATYGWTLTSPSGPLTSIAQPITDAYLTFTNAQTGAVVIVGAYRPARLSQFSENQGVSARNLNVTFTSIIASLRETWDKINDVTGRGLFFAPGNTTGPMPLPSACASAFLGFDSTGLNPLCRAGGPGSGNVVGPVSSTVNHLAAFGNVTGSALLDIALGTHLSIGSSTLSTDATGTGILATKGDVTSGVATALPNLTTSQIYGGTGGAGVAQVFPLGANISPALQIALNAANGLAGLDTSGYLKAAQLPILTGDVTTPGGSLATTIAANAVTNAKAAQMAAMTFKGNNTGSLANALDLSQAQMQLAVGPGAAWINADNYGTVHNGSTDDTAALQAALNACSSAGGGKVLIGPYQYLVNSANLSIPAYCALEGQFSPGGSTLTNAYGTVPYALLVNPTYTVSLHRNSGLRGVAVFASTMPLTAIATVQAAATAVQNFAGTGVTLGPEGSTAGNNGNDITVRDLLIMGFNQCVNATWADRSRGDHIYGDCTNGLLVNQSNDVSRWTNIHFWPFLVQNSTVGTPVNATITGAVNSGGLCKYTTSAANGFATGNVIIISAVGGTPNCVGVFTITVVDTTHFTANGSTFAGAYTSGGQATLDTAFRNGTAFQIENSVGTQFVGIFSYNYSFGINPTTGADYIDIANASIDGTLADNNPASTGYTINGNASGIHIFGGYVSSQASNIVNNTTGLAATTVVSVTLGNTGANALYAAAGALQMIGGTILGGSAANTVAGSATLDMIGVLASNSTNLTGGAVASQLTQIGPATTVNTVKTTSLAFTNLADSNVAPTISSGFGGGTPSISAPNGTDAFVVTIGTASGSTGVLAMPTATTGWNCQANDITTHTAANSSVAQTASATNSVTVTGYSDVTVAATWVSGDKIAFLCRAY